MCKEMKELVQGCSGHRSWNQDLDDSKMTLKPTLCSLHLAAFIF